MEERRAHERINALDAELKRHLEEHIKFEKAVADNAEMARQNAELIRQLVENTREIVDLVKGAKGFRALILWITPVVAAGYAFYVWVKS